MRGKAVKAVSRGRCPFCTVASRWSLRDFSLSVFPQVSEIESRIAALQAAGLTVRPRRKSNIPVSAGPGPEAGEPLDGRQHRPPASSAGSLRSQSQPGAATRRGSFLFIAGYF